MTELGSLRLLPIFYVYILLLVNACLLDLPIKQDSFYQVLGVILFGLATRSDKISGTNIGIFLI